MSIIGIAREVTPPSSQHKQPLSNSLMLPTAMIGSWKIPLKKNHDKYNPTKNSKYTYNSPIFLWKRYSKYLLNTSKLHYP
jgi:hypothetical protein